MSKTDLELFLDELEKVDPDTNREELNVVPLERKERPEEVTPIYPSPDIKTRVYTDYKFLKELKEKDFNIEMDTLIDLTRDKEDIKITDGYYFILFMDESQTGKEYLQRWLELAQIVKDDYCKMAYINLSFERKVLANFKSLAKIENINHPFYWAKFLELPFMMVYRNHWPVGFYNDVVNQSTLVDFIIKDIYEGLTPITKSHNLRNNLSEVIRKEIVESEEKLKSQNLKERALEEDKKNKEKIKELDPKTQEILEGENYLD